MKKILTILVIFNLYFGTETYLAAQITVTADDAPSRLGTTFEMSNAQNAAVDLGSPGPNQYWDFSGLNLPNKSTWTVVGVETTPFATYFPTSNLVYEVTRADNDTIEYNYAFLSETELTELGRGKNAVDDTVEILSSVRATPKLHLPATYGDENWSSVLEFVFNIFGTVLPVIDSSYNSIDAWGTMKTSYGEFPCLRIRQNHKRIAITNPDIDPLTIEHNVNYFWVTNVNSMGILATVTGKDTSANYTQAKSVNVMTNFVTGIDQIVRSEVPIQFKLFQNFPNPFNPTTSISYQLNNTADVRLKVFNISGQEVAVLVSEKQSPGMYSVPWDARDVGSGIYIYRLDVNGQSVARRCLLLK